MTSSGPAPAKLSALQYLGYAAGDAANNLAFSMASMFLLLYYTDVVGISRRGGRGHCFSSSASGTARRHRRRPHRRRTTTRWGKFRPYMLFGSLPLLLLHVAVFSVPDGLATAAGSSYA